MLQDDVGETKKRQDDRSKRGGGQRSLGKKKERGRGS